MLLLGSNLYPGKEVTHGSSEEAGLEEDHQERGKARGEEEGQVSATPRQSPPKSPRLAAGAFFGPTFLR